jgi:hypothetical protein
MVCHTAECLRVCACVFVYPPSSGLARNMQGKVLGLTSTTTNKPKAKFDR